MRSFCTFLLNRRRRESMDSPSSATTRVTSFLTSSPCKIDRTLHIIMAAQKVVKAMTDLRAGGLPVKCCCAQARPDGLTNQALRAESRLLKGALPTEPGGSAPGGVGKQYQRSSRETTSGQEFGFFSPGGHGRRNRLCPNFCPKVRVRVFPPAPIRGGSGPPVPSTPGGGSPGLPVPRGRR